MTTSYVNFQSRGNFNGVGRQVKQRRCPTSTKSGFVSKNGTNDMFVSSASSTTASPSSSRKKTTAHPFSIQSYSGGTSVKPAPSARAFSPRFSAPSDFRYFYERGDFPITVEHDTSQNKIAWKVCISGI